MHSNWLKNNQNEIIFHLWLQPGAKKSEFSGIHGELLKVKINAPAIDGKANTALCKFFAEYFCLRLNQVQITKGLSSRNKTLVLNITNDQITQFQAKLKIFVQELSL